MKIVTVNIPEAYVEAIEKLVGENGLYPSRSELIRVSVREFLLRELELVKNMGKFQNEPDMDFDDENFVRIPINTKNDNNEPIREFKTYKILKKLA